MNTPFANTLYYGDCLDIMASFPDSYIDLICLDPPFNSNEKYNKVFKDSGLCIDPQIKRLMMSGSGTTRPQSVLNASRTPSPTQHQIQCFSVEEYYRNNERWDRILTLPSLANPWTGKHMQQKILFDA